MVVYFIVRSGTVVSVLYLGVGRFFTSGVLGRNLALASSIWRNKLWFIFMVDWSSSVWVVMMDVGMLELVYLGVGAGTVAPGVLGRDIALSASTWRTGPWFLVAVAWSHRVWVVVMNLGMLGLLLVWVG